jgi:GT2 family glycosyltransferase
MNIDFFQNNPEWDVAVIIPTLKRHKYLHKTIELFYRQSILPKEIVVIDQSELDEMNLDDLKRFDDSIILDYYHLDIWGAKCAQNWGVKLSKSPIILLVDDDVEFEDDFVFNHLVALMEHRADNINGANVRPHGTLLSSPRIPGPWEDGIDILTHPRKVDFPCMTLQVNGNNSLYTREILLKVNGWDENVEVVSEDDEMSMKLFLHGGKMIYDPRPCLVHLKAPMGGFRDFWNESIYISFKKRQLRYPEVEYIYRYRKYFSTYAAMSYIVLVIIRGQFNYEIKKIRTFLKTPFRLFAAILNWRLATKMLKKSELGCNQKSPSTVKKIFTTVNN